MLASSSDEWTHIVGFIVVGAASAAAANWRFFVQWRDNLRGRRWPQVSASVDIVTVVEERSSDDSGERVIGYLATLTYFYRNPELQVGEYYRRFPNELEARAWAGPYKGRTVQVHVDPYHPARSVLRKEAL